MTCHQAQRFIQLLLRVDRDEFARCDLADRGAVGGLSFRDDANRDVAVGDGADELVAVDDGNNARVLVAHQPRRFDHGGFARECARVLRHQVTDAVGHH